MDAREEKIKRLEQAAHRDDIRRRISALGNLDFVKSNRNDYMLLDSGSVRRKVAKPRGKAAAKAAKRARQQGRS